MGKITENENPLSESIVIEDKERVVINKKIVAPSGEAAVEIPGNNAQLTVKSTGEISAPDQGNTAVQVSGKDNTIRNIGQIFGSLNGVSSTGEKLKLINRGTITSDSRAVDFVDGDGSSLDNNGELLGTGNQRNGTVYINGPVDDANINNRHGAVIDAGEGNTGDGISVQVGVDSEDLISDGIRINNRGSVVGRGQPGFEAGSRTTANGSSGVRFFNGTSSPEAIVRGSLNNSGTISSEANVGFLGGVVVENGVGFQGEINNNRSGLISGPRNGLYIGNADHDLTINNRRGGRIESGSRAVNLNGNDITLNNSGDIFGIGDQRDGTVYIDGPGDNITINNRRHGVIDAGEGNTGDGISVQVGVDSEDLISDNIIINNRGSVIGRGQPGFEAGSRTNANGSSGVRFFNGTIVILNDIRESIIRA